MVGFSDIGDAIANTMTLGGHGRVKSASLKYEDTFRMYKYSYNQVESFNRQIKEAIEKTGGETEKALRTILKAETLLKQIKNTSSYNIKNDNNISFSSIKKIERVNGEISSALLIGSGAASSSALTLGTWTLVSMLGTASTGTAIGSLSGVAATNATLAWFGGGSLATGGAGMLGGTTILTGFLALPVVAYSAWKSHSKAEEIYEEVEKLQVETHKLTKEIPLMDTNLQSILKQLKVLKVKHTCCKTAIKITVDTLYPFGVLSKFYRKIKSLFTGNYYTEVELDILSKLDGYLNSLIDVFDFDTNSI